MIEPIIERSINLCRKTLEEKRLAPGDIEKMILVGGPTLTPIFREILATKLQIPLEFSVDPFTVNARGAAIFAGMQLTPPDLIKKQRPKAAGQYVIDLLNYKPMRNDPEPLVGGIVTAPKGESLAGFTIEFIEAKTQWRSGKINLNGESKFVTNLHAAEGTNEFLIELKDSAGNICQSVPDRISYTLISNEPPGPPLIASIGVGLANGQMQIFLQKGTILAARHREFHHTTIALKKGESGALLNIPVFEGEITRRADRNSYIGSLEISGAKIKRDIPAGSEVEITIEINESRLLTTKAYINILDEEYENVLKFKPDHHDAKQLADDFEKEKARLEKVRGQARQVGDAQAEKPLRRIKDEDMIHEIEASLAAAKADPDAVAKCHKRLRDLKIAIDEADNAMEWPKLVLEAESTMEDTRKIIINHGKGDDQSNFESYERELKAAIGSHNADLLRQKIDQMEELRTKKLLEQDVTWIVLFEQLEQNRSQMRDQARAEQLFIQGRRAIENNDIRQLQVVVRELYGLIENPEKLTDPSTGTTMPKLHM